MRGFTLDTISKTPTRRLSGQDEVLMEIGSQPEYIQVTAPHHSHSLSFEKLKAESTGKDFSSNTRSHSHSASEPTTAKTTIETSPELRSISLLDLYRFATPFDVVCLVLGCLMANTSGALYPIMAVVFGDAATVFLRPDGSVNVDEVNSAALGYLYIAMALFVATTPRTCSSRSWPSGR